MENKALADGLDIDIFHLIKLLWNKAWILILSMILVGAMLFTYAVMAIAPEYKSSAMMYVNNSSFKVGGTSFSISNADLSAAKTLLDLYVVILKTRVTLEEVIDRADLNYTYEQLNGMVSAGSVNGTEIFRITVTSHDPAEAERIVSTIVEVLPDRIAEIVDGSSVRLVDHAVVPTSRSSPSYTRYGTIGMLLGLVISAVIIILIDLLDTTVRSEDYLKQKYDIPVLAVIPDVHIAKKNGYGSGYGYYEGYYNRRSKPASMHSQVSKSEADTGVGEGK